MDEDWYAFNGLPKDKIERARKFSRENESKMNVDNKDWDIIFNKWNPSKHIVRELCTGNNKVEEWNFSPLPKSIDPKKLTNPMYIDGNFVGLNFNEDGILLVNLATRKKFLIQSQVIQNQIKLVYHFYINDNKLYRKI